MSKDETFRPKARRPRGLPDRRGAGLAAERAIVDRVLGVYQAWGFERLDTSAFEYADALGKFLPDQDRPNAGVFALQDDDEQWLALRYDLTAPLARFVAENYDALPKPYRRCAAGPVWRNEKPGPGRFREFWQCDADTVGSASPAADAEMIAMACAALEAAGVKRGEFRVKVSDRRILDGLIEGLRLPPGVAEAVSRMGIFRSIDKLDRLGFDGVRELLTKGRKDESGDFTPGVGLSEEDAEEVVQFAALTAALPGSFNLSTDVIPSLRDCMKGSPNGVMAVSDIEKMFALLKALGREEPDVMLDTSIVRGLEYYTGAVYEAELLIETKDENGKPVRFGSVGGGGRYDDLVSRFKGQPIPATGFSIGVSRLAAALALAQGASDADGPVVVLPFDADGMGDCFAMAAELRSAGIASEVYLGGSGPKAQLKYADKRNAPAAVILGGDERAAGAVTIKDLKLGLALSALAESDREAWKARQGEVQQTLPRAAMVAHVRAILARAEAAK
jgi:histidyl-tRNA synthetase